MNDEHLEHRLRGLLSPRLPPTWRTEILAAARREMPRRSGAQQAWPALLVRFWRLCAQHPFTFAALTTLWILIFLLRAATPADPSSAALLARDGSAPPVFFPFIPEEIRLALLEQDGNSPPSRPLQP